MSETNKALMIACKEIATAGSSREIQALASVIQNMAQVLDGTQAAIQQIVLQLEAISQRLDQLDGRMTAIEVRQQR